VPLKPSSKIRKLSLPTKKNRRGKEKREVKKKRNKNVRYGGQSWHTFYIAHSSGYNYYFNFVLPARDS